MSTPLSVFTPGGQGRAREMALPISWTLRTQYKCYALEQSEYLGAYLFVYVLYTTKCHEKKLSAIIIW